MPWSSHVSTVAALLADGPVVTNSLGALTLLPHYPPIIFPKNYFDHYGQTAEANAFGRLSSVEGSTLILRIELSGVVVAKTQEFTLPNLVNIDWALTLWFQQRSIGTSSTFVSAGRFSIDSTDSVVQSSIGNAFDATQSQFMDVTAEWSTASANNSIQLKLAVLKMLN